MTAMYRATVGASSVNAYCWSGKLRQRSGCGGQSRRRTVSSFCVMKNDAERVAMAPTHSADAMAQVNAIVAANSANWTAVHGEHHTVAFGEGHDFDARLHPRA